MGETVKKQYSIVLAAGGTGGHIFPAEALMEELQRRGHLVTLVTDARYKNYATTLPENVCIIRASSPSGGLVGRLKAAVEIGFGYFQARALLRKLKPQVVVGFGGYPAFPTMLAATRMRIKTVIHEQNSVLGKVNAYLASSVGVIATAFPEVIGIDERNSSKVVITGNPVRAAIRAIRDMAYPELQQDGVLRLLVTGGSQGASVFSTVIPEAIGALPESYRNRIRIDQQCRAGEVEATRARYAAMNISADLASFFSDIPTRLASAHLVVARAGASSLAELTVAGRPVILVPYPNATGNHQLYNARALEEKGGGWVMPQEAFTVAALSARLEAFFGLPSTLTKAAAHAREAGLPDAVMALADTVEKCAG
jgi:UDP-N-acetylglucosamine--N-acetylmuramyl-(pentapeptide) pyrophosphoryl-undecaprenol N-acetylglucosamine transferase